MLRAIVAFVLAAAMAREGPYLVEKVSDGDTIAVRRGRSRVTVRLIGVDAPEIEGPYRRAEKGGYDARREMERILAGRKVYLQLDSYQPERDSHGRLLAFVYANGILANEEIIRRGYARAYRKFRHDRREKFLRYENEARAGGRGLWKNGGSP